MNTCETPLPTPQQIESWWHAATSPLYGCLPQHMELAQRAAEWAAEEQLGRCCGWVQEHYGTGARMRNELQERQAPDSLRKQAIEALERLVRRNCDVVQEAEDIAFLHNLLEGIND